jgi:cytochrome c-type biogenesis protein CcmH/NrfG
MFHQAVGFDNGNATARQRLAAIAMSKGAYSDALAHMQSAWSAGHRDNTTRMLLGDAYVANGSPDLAAETVQGLPWAASRLSLQAAFRYTAQNDHKRATEAWSTVVLLEPNNASAAQSQRDAEQRTKQQR